MPNDLDAAGEPRWQEPDWQEPDTLSRLVAANIRYAMSFRGVTGVELSEAIGLPRSGVSERSVGRTRWQLDELPKVAEYLNVSLGFLIGLPVIPRTPGADDAPDVDAR